MRRLEDSTARRLSPAAKRRATADGQYARYCRPKLAELLSSLALDITFTRASGNYVHDGSVPVLDLVGGFGAALLGHNNGELKRVLVERLEADTPVLAQSSLRDGAGALAARLNDLIPADGRYYCNFSNSGAEAVEAALKHAYKVRFDEIRRAYERITRDSNELCRRIRREDLEVPGGDLEKFRDDLDELNLTQFEGFRRSPVVVALKGSFHGKTSSAVKVTFNETYREGFEGLSAIQPVFLDPADVARLPHVVAEHHIDFLVPRIEDGRVVVEREPMTRAIAFIMEVILGEGGIRVLTDESLAALARAHRDLDTPFILDEIQTGCGRTGAMFAYSRTPLAAIEPEYVTLSKALGGGLVKIAATLIHERVYDPDFGILHTSTFAEDDPSCAVALRALDILERDDGWLMRQVRTKGDYLRTRLETLRARYPAIVRDVRGRGLMIGIEFEPLLERSPLFRYAGTQGFLSLLVASYLLHHHRIRVMAPITTLFKGNPGKERPSILRIQPAAYITRYEMDRCVRALDEVLNIIEHNNEYLLVGHLVGDPPSRDERRAPRRMPVVNRRVERREDFDGRVGFILHPTSMDRLVDYYLPSFRHYDFCAGKLSRWWTSLAKFLEPDVIHTAYLSQDGFVVEANLVAVPYLPGYLARALTKARRKPSRASLRELREIRDKIQDAVTVARELGDDHVPTSMVGLGAFTSIVTAQGTTINDYEVPITTGNAHTAGLMVQAIERAARIRGLDAGAIVAVVGATGNIGAVLAELLSRRFGRLKLVGRAGSRGRLEALRATCAGAAVSLHDDLAAIADCDIVAVATSSTDGRLITPDLVKRGAIVCCASMPSNLCATFKDHLREYFVFDGGYARLPEGNAIDCVGLPKDGLSYGCLSETLLLGFDGRNRSFAKGPLDTEQVRHALELAEEYGFSLGDFHLGQEPHPGSES